MTGLPTTLPEAIAMLRTLLADPRLPLGVFAFVVILVASAFLAALIVMARHPR